MAYRWARRLVPSTRRGRLFVAGAAIAVVAASVFGLLAWLGSDGVEEPAAVETTLPSVDLEVVVDSTLVPIRDAVPPLVEGGAPRPVGRSLTESGTAYDFVIGELVVFVADHDALEVLRQREGIEVVDYDDTFLEDFGPGDPDAGIEVLIRVTDLAAVDTSRLAYDLSVLEPWMTGTLRLSDQDTMATVAVMANLAVAEDLEVALNDLPSLGAIPQGFTAEHGGEDAFEWTYVASTATQEIGLDTAWQMLYAHGRQLNTVKVLVVDMGFMVNGDLPPGSKIRKGDWGPEPDAACGPTGEARCPYHGVHVAATVVGRVDNGYGTAGAAGPFAELVVMPHQGDYFSNTRAIRQVVKDERPDIINMSFGRANTKNTRIVRNRWDRIMRWAEEQHGVLAFASAGNQGTDVDSIDGGLYLPCASRWVVCVGGLSVDSVAKHSGSNFGTQRSSRSVQIYGPYCTWGYANPDDPADGSLAQVCGTSFASPFVAGVAALLRVADPSLSPDQMRTILFETAHQGVSGIPTTGFLRRVNAHAAVERALGTTWEGPSLTITEGEGTYPVGEFFSLAAEARSFTGEALPVRWRSSIDGWLMDAPTMSPVSGSGLSPGEHVIEAIAVDRRRLQATEQIVVVIDHLDPLVAIVSPKADTVLYEGFGVSLVGFAADPNPFGATVEMTGRWTIRNQAGQLVWSTTTIPSAISAPLAAGTYTVTFEVVDMHGATAQDSVVIEVKELDPDWHPPSVTIIQPSFGTTFGVTPGNPQAEIELQGHAMGTTGLPIPGERFRWTATNNHGDEVVLCTGSHFPGSGGGGGGGFGIVIPVSCAHVTVELGLGSGGPTTAWSITLEAHDLNAGAISRVTSVTVHLVVQ